MAIVLVVADVTQTRGLSWLSGHPWTSQMLSNVVVVSATYLLVERAITARERHRWLDVTWDRVEDLATALYHFLDAAERDWLSDERPAFPMSEEAPDVCLEQLEYLHDKTVMIAAVAPASPELASFLDYVSEIRQNTDAWRQAVLRERGSLYDNWPDLQGPTKRALFFQSRFQYVFSLLNCYRRLSEDVDTYLAGNHLEGLTFETASLEPLEHASRTDWSTDEWNVHWAPLKTAARREYWRDRGVEMP